MGTLEKEWIEIQGYKHDGGMHRIWDSAYCLVDNDKYFAVCSKKEIGRASCRERV